jgi:predicted lipoprotein with Yx(FWY)xxD motif
MRLVPLLLGLWLVLVPNVQAQTAQVTAPALSQLATQDSSHPWFAAAPLPHDYVEQEFELSGMAGIYHYTSPPPPPWTVEQDSTQPYITRVLVRRPADPSAANGVVVVEWLNVTAGYDQDIEWQKASEYFMRTGYTYIGVSAQQGGTNALQKWDPSRYADLSIVDDGQSYDIFSQVAAAARQAGSPLLGGIAPRRIVATGVSQSAWRLVVYINAFHPLARVYDGYFLHSRGRGAPPIQGTGVISDQRPVPIETDVDVPVFLLQTEGDLLGMDYAVARQPDTELTHTWEVAGAPHVGAGSAYDVAIGNGIRTRDLGTGAPASNPACQPNPFPIWPVADAAWDHLVNWVNTGAAPPVAPAIQLTRQPTLAAVPPGDGNSLVRRDELGNAEGGIRTPALDAPLGAYYGSSTCAPGLLGFLGGQYVPFDGATLARLYPTHDDYVFRVTASAEKAVNDGFVLQDDADRLIGEAQTSTIPSLAASQPTAPIVQLRNGLLTDRQGFTLYTSDADSPTNSACTGDCLNRWAPTLLESGDPVTPAGLPGKLGILVRPDGGRQVTYNGHPLYRYTADLTAGDTGGDNLAGQWHLALH